jgi:hypothetical protein
MSLRPTARTAASPEQIDGEHGLRTAHDLDRKKGPVLRNGSTAEHLSTVHRNRRNTDMMIQEIERTSNGSKPVDLSPQDMWKADLDLKKIFYPYGFPVEVKTNSSEVLDILEPLWGRFEQAHDTVPISAEMYVVQSDSMECPPLPDYRITSSLFITIADRDNYSIIDMEHSTAQVFLSSAALRHKLYAGYYFLTSPISCIATRYTTPVHAGCVALDGRGVLLCGDSGAGKSTLSYACARSGWTYICDDGSFVLNSRTDRIASGNCYQVRFRPSAADHFPEIEGLKMMPRAAGKPSVEMHTSMIPELNCAQTTQVDFIVFLNRRAEGRATLAPCRKEVARQYIQQLLYGSEKILGPQHETIERLLAAEVFELRYRDLGWAVSRLQRMVREGR